MGGCCCCFPRETEVNNTPGYYYYPRAAEEHLPLSHNRPSSVVSTELQEDANAETSTLDPYRPPSTPISFDAALRHPQTPQRSPGIHINKNNGDQGTTDSDSTQETVDGITIGVSTGVEEKEQHWKTQTNIDLESTKKPETELSKKADPLFTEKMEEDDCPICLEEYDAENPKMMTKCDHHFHLACILEWMERGDTCPVCDKGIILIE